jgi:hypothetical protein
MAFDTHPKGYSVNDCIKSEICSLSDSSADDAVERVVKLGKGMN